MKQYEVETKLVLKGKFYIKAVSKKQAKEFVEKHCGLVIAGYDIHCSLPDDDMNWNFNVYADKLIGKITTK